MTDNIYTCLGCGEKISSDLLDYPKCGRRTKAGKQVDFEKKNGIVPPQKLDKKEKPQILIFNFYLFQ